MKALLRFFALLAFVLVSGGMLAGDAAARGGRGGGGRGGGGRGGGGRGGGGRGGGRGGGSGGEQSRRDVAKDLEERRAQEDKEARLSEARGVGATAAFDELHQKLLDEEREKAAAERREDWRSRANPG